MSEILEQATPGRAAYEAYRHRVTPADEPLINPPEAWYGLSDDERAAWEAAAEAGTAAHSLSGTGALMGDIIALRAERDRLAAAFGHTCRRVQAVLDRALGTEVRAGEGLAADVALMAGQRDRLAAALRRLASGDWLGNEGYDGDELARRREYASDVLKSASAITGPAADARACGLTGCLERLAATYAQHAVDAGADGQRGAATAYRVVMADLERLVTEHAALCALTFPGPVNPDAMPLPSLAAIRAYLEAIGWSEYWINAAAPRWAKSVEMRLTIPADDSDPDVLSAAVDRIARAEGRTPAETAAAINAAWKENNRG